MEKIQLGIPILIIASTGRKNCHFKGEGYVMSNLIKYVHKCLNTLGLMTKYVLEEE